MKRVLFITVFSLVLVWGLCAITYANNTIFNIEPSHCLLFYADDLIVGELNFESGQVVFIGDVKQSVNLMLKYRPNLMIPMTLTLGSRDGKVIDLRFTKQGFFGRGDLVLTESATLFFGALLTGLQEREVVK